MRKMLCCVVVLLLLCACAAEPITLPFPVNPQPNAWIPKPDLTTLDELIDYADCIAVLRAVDYDQEQTRTEMEIIEDLGGNLDSRGCPEGCIYVWNKFEPGETYLCFLSGGITVGRSKVVYLNAVDDVLFPLQDGRVMLQYLGQLHDWAAEEDLIEAATDYLAKHPKPAIEDPDTATSYAEALEQADEVWLIEITSIKKGRTEDFDRCRYDIIAVLRGEYDEADHYSEMLPVIAEPQVGARYLLLKRHTERYGLDIVSGKYCLVPASDPLFAAWVE